MDTMISYCGLLCNECPAYTATVNNDDALRQKTAAEWSQMFGGAFKAEDINCLGCQSEVLIGHCKVCNIRACGVEKAVANCAACDQFGCEKAVEFWQHAPGVKERLEKIRAGN